MTSPIPDQDAMKAAVARAALDVVLKEATPGSILGIGTGSTADLFIDALAEYRDRFGGAVASSERSAARLTGHGWTVVDLNDAGVLSHYVDGADEVTPELALLKGGGGALTREKIVAASASTFICIVDSTKRVDTLGGFPLPVEVLPMARAHVVRVLGTLLGASAVIRRRESAARPYMTDNGNEILDISGVRFSDARSWESRIEAIVGVVCCGIFAHRGADLLLVGTNHGVEAISNRGDIPSSRPA